MCSDLFKEIFWKFKLCFSHCLNRRNNLPDSRFLWFPQIHTWTGSIPIFEIQGFGIIFYFVYLIIRISFFLQTKIQKRNSIFLWNFYKKLSAIKFQMHQFKWNFLPFVSSHFAARVAILSSDFSKPIIKRNNKKAIKSNIALNIKTFKRSSREGKTFL